AVMQVTLDARPLHVSGPDRSLPLRRGDTHLVTKLGLVDATRDEGDRDRAVEHAQEDEEHRDDDEARDAECKHPAVTERALKRAEQGGAGTARGEHSNEKPHE